MEARTEMFRTTSGKEMTVTYHNDEPHSVSWNDGDGKHTLSENEISEVYEYVFENDDDDDDEDGDE